MSIGFNHSIIEVKYLYVGAKMIAERRGISVTSPVVSKVDCINGQ